MNQKALLKAQNAFQFLFYTSKDGKLKLEVYWADENVWLTQKKMAELYGVDRSVVTKHLKNIYDSGEVDERSTCAKIAQVQQEGSRQVEREIEYYNLDVILSVGYRVNSIQATEFRKWATNTLKEYLIKGFVMDDERLKQGKHFGKDYFDELLERIRDIRTSEMRIHLKLAEIFALSSNYSDKSELTKHFFAFIQNKLHYAITGHTAAEIIYNRADSTKPRMGLTANSGGPNKKVIKKDVTVAKNYLSEKELKSLQRTVTAFLDIAETRAQNGNITTMEKWLNIMDGYLDLNDFPKLQHAGKVSQLQAEVKAVTEYEKYKPIQDQTYITDFEKHIRKLQETE